MDFGTAILYVIAVLAIMGVSGIIIYALSGLIISIIDKKSVKLFKKGDGEQKSLSKADQQFLLEDKDFKLDLDDDKIESNESDIDLDMAETEKKEIKDKGEQSVLEQRMAIVNENHKKDTSKEDDLNKTENDMVEDTDYDLEDVYQKLISEINLEATSGEGKSEELIKDFKMDTEISKTEENTNTFDVFDEDEEISIKDEDEDIKNLNVDEDTDLDKKNIFEAEIVKEEIVKSELADEKLKDLEAQINSLKEQLKNEQSEKDEAFEKTLKLQEQLQNTPAKIIYSKEDIDGLNNRLDILNDRLKLAEKDLKSNKKEYFPLAKIKNTLENDKAKLRRKEAIVANQKNVMFGVNNYVVDPEKEKKLSEDLDVLDAFRLSVQHAEDVMKQNADRFPILEKTYKMLSSLVEDIKSDIAEIEDKIRKINND